MTREELNEGKQKEIFREERKEKNKKYVVLGFKFLLVFVVIFYSFVLYNSYISTGAFIVKEQRIVDSNIPQSFNGIKIIQFSDLHYGSNIDSAKFNKIINLINERNPDLVFFTGDLVDENYKLDSNSKEELIKLLKKIKAPLGKYAIFGDEDDNNYNTIITQGDFTVLDNDYELLYNKTNDAILLSGFGSMLKKNIDVDKGLGYYNSETANSSIYSIAIFHEPDAASIILDKHNTNLLLAGHSHNGNIRIPYLGSIIKKDGAKEYDQEYYEISGSKLFISSGLGTKNDGVRLFCKPSINFFRLSNS